EYVGNVGCRSESQSPTCGGLPGNRQAAASREGGGSRSNSRPRPRSEEIPMEDMMHGSLPQPSPSMSKVNMEVTSSPQGSTSSNSSNCSHSGEIVLSVDERPSANKDSPSKLPLSVPSGVEEALWPCISLIGNPNVTPSSACLHPPLSHVPTSVVLSTASDIQQQCASKPSLSTKSCTPQPDENETSFTAKPPLTRTHVNYDVFEPNVSGNRGENAEVMEKGNGEVSRNSVGPADFSPIRKIRVKGNIETV
ncbi:hypothetical protein SK128_024858, partial [Halocaridina rubra]